MDRFVLDCKSISKVTLITRPLYSEVTLLSTFDQSEETSCSMLPERDFIKVNGVFTDTLEEVLVGVLWLNEVIRLF